MKFSSLFTKISTLLLVSTKAVSGNRQCEDGTFDALNNVNPALGETYCYLYDTGGPANAGLYATVVFTSFNFDQTGAFLETCLEDLLVASQMSALNINRQDCGDGKTEIALFSTLESKNYPSDSTKYNVVDGIVKVDLGWDVAMCKSDSCNADVLQKVLTATWLDFYDLTCPCWRADGWYATSTVTPTGTCTYDQIGAALNNPELYCSADAPTCSNIKLVEISLYDDAPFEVAICDDNECLASTGAVNIPGYMATGTVTESYSQQEEYETQNDPFCIKPITDNNIQRNQKYVSATISDKAFDKTKYCTVKAASARAGKCKSTKAPKTLKEPKAPKFTKAPKESKAPKATKAPKESKAPKATKAPKSKSVGKSTKAKGPKSPKNV